MASKHSSVQHSACGATITLSIVSRGLAGSTGSCSKTSMPAPAIVPERRASIRAVSSATGPRAMFTK